MGAWMNEQRNTHTHNGIAKGKKFASWEKSDYVTLWQQKKEDEEEEEVEKRRE